MEKKSGAYTELDWYIHCTNFTIKKYLNGLGSQLEYVKIRLIKSNA